MTRSRSCLVQKTFFCKSVVNSAALSMKGLQKSRTTLLDERLLFGRLVSCTILPEQCIFCKAKHKTNADELHGLEKEKKCHLHFTRPFQSLIRVEVFEISCVFWFLFPNNLF